VQHQQYPLTDIRFKRIRVLSPIGKKKRYHGLDLTAVHAAEPSPPAGRKRIEWKLLIDISWPDLSSSWR
jgi:hypothetical protein